MYSSGGTMLRGSPAASNAPPFFTEPFRFCRTVIYISRFFAQRLWTLGRQRWVTYIHWLLAHSQRPIEDRAGQRRGRPGAWKEKSAPLALIFFNRRSPEEGCWQCGKMCFSLKHAQECMSAHTQANTHRPIHNFEVGLYLLQAYTNARISACRFHNCTAWSLFLNGFFIRTLSRRKWTS